MILHVLVGGTFGPCFFLTHKGTLGTINLARTVFNGQELNESDRAMFLQQSPMVCISHDGRNIPPLEWDLRLFRSLARLDINPQSYQDTIIMMLVTFTTEDLVILSPTMADTWIQAMWCLSQELRSLVEVCYNLACSPTTVATVRPGTSGFPKSLGGCKTPLC